MFPWERGCGCGWVGKGTNSRRCNRRDDAVQCYVGEEECATLSCQWLVVELGSREVMHGDGGAEQMMLEEVEWGPTCPVQSVTREE